MEKQEFSLGMLEVHYRTIDGPVPPDFVSQWREKLTVRAHELLKEDGGLAPVVFFLSDNPSDPAGLLEGFLSLSDIMSMPNGKDVLAQLMPKVFGELKAFAVCQITESWTCFDEQVNKDYEAGKYESLADAPEAIEVIMVSLQTKKNTGLWLYKINRDEAGKVTGANEEPIEGTGDLHGNETDTAMTGRFTGWIADDGKAAN